MNRLNGQGPSSTPAARARSELARADARDADQVQRAGALSLMAGLVDEAIPLVEAALRIHSSHARLWQLLGLLHRGLDDLAPAIAALAKAAELAPGDASIAQTQARVAMEAGLPAIDLAERALRLAPSDGAALLALASACLAEGQGERAIALLEERLRSQPAWLAAHRSVARMRWSLGERASFASSLETAVEAAPGDASIWQTYIELLLQAELYEDVLSVASRARAASGAHRNWAAAEAVSRAERGESEAADRLFAQLLPFSDVPSLVQYVRHLLRSGRVEQAVEAAWREAPRDPHNLLWPYLSAGWRLTGDPRWQWLEGDERLVGTYDLSDALAPLDALAEQLRGLHLLPHQPLHQSIRGGTQSEGHLFARIAPEIRALRTAVVEAVKRHVAQLPPRQPDHPLLAVPRTRIGFAGSWSVRLTGGGHHASHVHPAGWLSSAFYIALPSAQQVGEAPAGWLALGEPPPELGLGLPPLRLIEPKPGRLVLFPSTMWHGTRAFAAGERLTVAFDVERPAG